MNDKIKGSIYGLLIGDALGAPYEFRTAEYMESLAAVDMLPPQNHQRTYKEAKVGTWSDEGAMMLCMMNTINDCHAFKPDFYLRQLVAYKTQGLYAINHTVFGCSRHFDQVIKTFQEGGKIFHLDANMTSRDSGTLTRVLPLAIFDAKNDATSTIRLAHTQALLTHAHPINGICSAIYAQWIKNLVNGIKNPFVKAINSLLELYNTDCRELIVRDVLRRNGSTGINDIVDCLMDTYDIISKTDSYHDAVIMAVKKGGQTTALASSVGAIAGLIYGFQDIPSKWVGLLRGQETVEQLLARFEIELGA